MHLFIFFILLTIGPVYSNVLDHIHSAGVVLSTVNSDSVLQDKDKNSVLTFKPNVSTGTGLSLETELFGLTYTIAGDEAQVKDEEMSVFSDLRFNFHLKHFDFRLMFQRYKGALVDEGGESEFYRDYEVKSQNARIHYYFNSDHLNYIRDGKKLVNKVAQNEGINFSTSWFLGLNVDSRSIELPDDLLPEHQAIVDEKISQYDSSFAALSYGPLVGYDWLALWRSVFIRLKLAGGPAFQGGNSTVSQFELALNTGFALKKNHLITLGMDLYNLNFKDSDQRISNTNAQVVFGYTYAFNLSN